MQPARPVILVVEDVEQVAELLSTLLTQKGYNVETAPRGSDGLARVKRGGIDLVLLDLMLPDVHGLEVCQAVRALPSQVYLPIIMLTALATDTDRHAGFAAGADDYVTKPFKTDELLDRVGVWLRTRQYLKTAHDDGREPAADEQTTLGMALATSHDLIRLLTLLLSLLESWEASTPSPDDISRLRLEFRQAATVLAARINTLTRAARSASHASSDIQP
jgi:DNA-binding response OmpR family regulator